MGQILMPGFSGNPLLGLILRCALFLLAGVLCYLVSWSFIQHSGDVAVLAIFHSSFFFLLVVSLLRPRFDTYFFLTLFLVLGFWVKWLSHRFFDYPFVEPVGQFSGDPGQVDLALKVASVAALGVASCRLLIFFVGRFKFVNFSVNDCSGYPRVYSRFLPYVWGAIIFFALLIYLANYNFAFFQVGVNAKLKLQFGLGALLAWLVYCGAPMAFILALDWEIARRSDRYWPVIFGVCLFALVMSVSMASRAMLPFLYLAVGVSLYFHKPAYLSRMVSSWRLLLPIVMISFFVSTMFLVSAFRVNTYRVEEVPQPPQEYQAPQEYQGGGVLQPPPTVDSQALYKGMFFQVMQLAVDRWIGMEGVLAVASSDKRDSSLLFSGVIEDPGKGVDAIYQRLAGSFYKHQDDVTFLTLPGVVAVLFYSGSLLVVFLGMMILTAILIAIEKLSLLMTRSRLLTSWVAILMANSICQMNFPYLWGVFVLECCVALIAVGIFRMIFSREFSHA
ncbi:hypothetical protein M2318_005075 [Metapseudomonas resinovorans]|uniref:hypothetical protein n=1 Tax=Metapseudomonas resinovorans TaxID=53412 RepID=UPI003D1ABAD7